MIGRELQRLRAALQFLTRLPAGRIGTFEAQGVARASRYFPLVGALVGLIAGLILVASSLVFPQPLPLVFALAAVILVTGGLHEDALADAADGLFAPVERERRFEIMKDSRVGAFGTLALIAVLGAKIAALLPIDVMSAARVLVAALAVGRFTAVAGMWLMPYAAPAAASKLGPDATASTAVEAVIAAALALTIGVAVVSPVTLAFGALAALAAAFAVAVLAKRRLGGATGDIFGAMILLSETAFMIGAAAVIAGPG